MPAKHAEKVGRKQTAVMCGVLALGEKERARTPAVERGREY